MSIESASIVAIVIGAVAVLASMVYALVRALKFQSRLKRISNSPAFVAASKLPRLGDRIAAGVQQLQAIGGRLDVAIERLTAAHEASDRLSEAIASVATCVVDLLETFAPSLRGSAP